MKDLGLIWIFQSSIVSNIIHFSILQVSYIVTCSSKTITTGRQCREFEGFIPDIDCEQNPGWGSREETRQKILDFLSDRLLSILPVPGAREGVQELRNMGYRLVVVTAREKQHAALSCRWLNLHFFGAFQA